MKRSLFYQAAVLLILAFLPGIGQALYLRDRISWTEPAMAQDEVDVAEARGWGDGVLWVDARPREQFDQGHIPGAVLLNEDSWNELLPQFLAGWSPEKRVIVYCSSQSCAASHAVAKRLRAEAELKNILVLHGGWESWQAAAP